MTSPGAAFVIGGSGGLGSAICRRLAQDWPSIALTYRSNAKAADALCRDMASQCDAVAFPCDLTNTSSVQSAVDAAIARFGRIGTVIIASGAPIAQPFVGDILESAWQDVIETELLGFTRIVTATLPHLRQAGGGNYVALVSMANYSYPPGDALSAVPKAAIESLGRAIAREEGRNRIRANMVAPGIIDAGLGATFLTDLYTPEIWETQRRRVALRRFGHADEVANAVAFLASEQAAYITGQTIVVDGGFSL